MESNNEIQKNLKNGNGNSNCIEKLYTVLALKFGSPG
jgi:hypothetical protein